jgi:hypothetical protein
MVARAFIASNVKDNLGRFMKKILTLISVSFLLFSCAKNPFHKVEIISLKVSKDFVQGSEDIPLLLGMEKVYGESVGFDSSSGSIMSSSYTTKNDLKAIFSFYFHTLPDMGWRVTEKSKDKLIFKRDNEKLEIDFTKQDKQNMVKFFISSAL